MICDPQLNLIFHKNPLSAICACAFAVVALTTGWHTDNIALGYQPVPNQ